MMKLNKLFYKKFQVKKPGEKGFAFVTSANKSYMTYLKAFLVNIKKIFGCKQKIVGIDLGGISEEPKMVCF